MPALLQLIGVAAVTAGATLIYPPAGFIVGGFLLVLVGVAVERGKNAE